MNVTVSSEDFTTLPAALLPVVKQYERIDHADDDEVLKFMLADAIAEFQRWSQITVNVCAIVVEPAACDFASASTLRLPVTPITQFAVKDGDGDALTGYRLSAKGVHGVRIYWLQGPWQEAMAIEIVSGYAPDKLPPWIRSPLMMIVGRMYEFREIYIPGAFEMPPHWLNEVTAGLWLPRF